MQVTGIDPPSGGSGRRGSGSTAVFNEDDYDDDDYETDDEEEAEMDWSNFQGERLPVVHFRGTSRSLHASWDPNANSRIRGTVRQTPEGAIRWTTFSIFHGEERWRSEGIQVGGLKSGRGVLGNWFDKVYTLFYFRHFLLTLDTDTSSRTTICTAQQVLQLSGKKAMSWMMRSQRVRQLLISDQLRSCPDVGYRIRV